jgi:hypothetical protein
VGGAGSRARIGAVLERNAPDYDADDDGIAGGDWRAR